MINTFILRERYFCISFIHTLRARINQMRNLCDENLPKYEQNQLYYYLYKEENFLKGSLNLLVRQDLLLLRSVGLKYIF